MPDIRSTVIYLQLGLLGARGMTSVTHSYLPLKQKTMSVVSYIIGQVRDDNVRVGTATEANAQKVLQKLYSNDKVKSLLTISPPNWPHSFLILTAFLREYSFFFFLKPEDTIQSFSQTCTKDFFKGADQVSTDIQMGPSSTPKRWILLGSFSEGIRATRGKKEVQI